VTTGASPHRLRVCLDARLSDGVCGGVQQTIIGLARGLSGLDDGTEEYLFLAREGSDAWLRPHLFGRCRIIHAPAPPLPPSPAAWKRPIRALLADPVKRLLDEQVMARLIRFGPSPSDGTIELARVDVMHFTMQDGFETGIPSIFVPHDLQHLHHPGFFTLAQRRWRAAVYAALARQARHVVALSTHGKQDLVSRLRVPPEKVSVIGWAPPVDAYGDVSEGDLARARAKFQLPPAFALYPAQTWRHKNHLRLLDALARLRDREGLEVPIVFTGRLNEFHEVLQRRVRELRLDGQVRWLDFVSPSEMQSLYRLARMLVFPSRFEGFGMPVFEAFRSGVPVACSGATSLPEVAGGAALLFDPVSTDEIAAAVHRLWSDAGLRGELVEKGRRRVEGIGWREVARRYRALYRLVGGRALDERDRALLDEIAR
jgi:glycosyltransferase involved in cell wall biosynthesis